MSKRLQVINNYLIITDTITQETREFPKARVRYRDTNNNIELRYIDDTSQNVIYQFNELVDSNDVAWSDIPTLLNWLRINTGGGANVNEDGSINVVTQSPIETLSQDPTSPSFDLYFSEALGSPTTLLADINLDDKVITIADTSNFNVGTWIGIFSGTGRYMWAEVQVINGNDLTLDRLVDYPFNAGSNVLPTNRNIAVDGSVTPRIFSIQAGNTGLEIDITRLIISMICQDPIQLNLYGDQPALTNGLLLRKVNGDYRNLINTKTNYEIGVHSYDLTIYEQIKQNDVNALLARSTWAGASKRGVVIRLKQGEELQLVVQDDLSGILNFWVLAQGHEVY